MAGEKEGQDPDFRGEEWRQALIWLHGGEPEQALVFFERVVRYAPADYEAWLNIGYCRAVLGRLNLAVEAYTRAVALRPEVAVPYARRGGVRLKQELWDEAGRDFAEAAQLAPDDALILCNLALALGGQGKLTEALRAVHDALRLQPEFAFAHYQLGWLYSQAEQWPEAAEAFRRAVAIEPEFAKAHYNLGLNYLVLGDLPAAMAELDILRKLNRKLADHLLKLIKP